ncbi:MAG: restriction endonuclease [Anaerolineae bacterium]|nr:restriction endonuclease [Anaerolineae bacterium]
MQELQRSLSPLYDPDTIDPEEQARLELGPYYTPPASRSWQRARIRRVRRRGMRTLTIATAAWILLYLPFFLSWAVTGRRPLDFILRLLPSSWLWAVFLTHTVLVGGIWGWLWWRAERERRRLQEKLRAARTLAQLLELTPSEFEAWTGELFRRRGYRVINTPDTADHGVDLIVDRDGERGIVQCKRYRGTVGEPIVRDLYAVIIHEGADRGYLVTTANISPQAHRWARGKPIELIDGEKLVRLASD